MKINISRLIGVSLICFFSAFFLVTRYFEKSDKGKAEKIANYQKLLKNGKHVIARYDTVYTVFEKNSTNPTKYINYYFSVNNKQYDDSKQIIEVPTEMLFDLIYLPSNPEIHSENPPKDLAYWQNMKVDHSFPFIAWFLFIATSAILINTFKKLLTNNKQSQ